MPHVYEQIYNKSLHPPKEPLLCHAPQIANSRKAKTRRGQRCALLPPPKGLHRRTGGSIIITLTAATMAPAFLDRLLSTATCKTVQVQEKDSVQHERGKAFGIATKAVMPTNVSSVAEYHNSIGACQRAVDYCSGRPGRKQALACRSVPATDQGIARLGFPLVCHGDALPLKRPPQRGAQRKRPLSETFLKGSVVADTPSLKSA